MMVVGPTYVSAVEQFSTAYANLSYYGTFPSSWDELVIEVRSHMQLPGIVTYLVAQLSLIVASAVSSSTVDRCVLD